MSFPAKLFSIKGNLVVMKNLYHKVAVASICTALSFALGANKEVKAATITLEPAINFKVIDYSKGGVGVPDWVHIDDNSYFGKVRAVEERLFTEFNIGFSFPNEDITSVFLQTQIEYLGGSVGEFRNPGSFGLFGYVGNGRGNLSDFGAGELLSSVNTSFLSSGDFLSIDVTGFVKQRASNGDPFAGFGFRVFKPGFVELGGNSFSGYPVTLVVETVPVPEPTTIFGSAIGLCLGGWLKRKKLSRSNKTTPQH
jgi:hypothetical protein